MSGQVLTEITASVEESWPRAFAAAFLGHVVWIGLLIWYVKFPDYPLCAKEEGGGFRFTAVCPDERPFHGQVTFLLIVFGPILSMLIGMYAGRVRLHLASIVFLGILLQTPAVILCLVYLWLT